MKHFTWFSLFFSGTHTGADLTDSDTLIVSPLEGSLSDDIDLLIDIFLSIVPAVVTVSSSFTTVSFFLDPDERLSWLLLIYFLFAVTCPDLLPLPESPE